MQHEADFDEEEYFIIRFKGPKKVRDEIFDYINGKSADYYQYSRNLEDMEMARARNLKELFGDKPVAVKEEPADVDFSGLQREVKQEIPDEDPQEFEAPPPSKCDKNPKKRKIPAKTASSSSAPKQRRSRITRNIASNLDKMFNSSSGAPTTFSEHTTMRVRRDRSAHPRIDLWADRDNSRQWLSEQSLKRHHISFERKK
ncbi:unnamed protein product [Caenorhabditis sp. 36 PRJEB53466]|nr:unnamed protein product [Caenorhabditis sp. 36 PRJEB53466]